MALPPGAALQTGPDPGGPLGPAGCGAPGGCARGQAGKPGRRHISVPARGAGSEVRWGSPCGPHAHVSSAAPSSICFGGPLPPLSTDFEGLSCSIPSPPGTLWQRSDSPLLGDPPCDRCAVNRGHVQRVPLDPPVFPAALSLESSQRPLLALLGFRVTAVHPTTPPEGQACGLFTQALHRACWLHCTPFPGVGPGEEPAPSRLRCPDPQRAAERSSGAQGAPWRDTGQCPHRETVPLRVPQATGTNDQMQNCPLYLLS